MSFLLSKDQTDAVHGVYDTLFVQPAQGAHALAVLTGSAGVGKTTVVQAIIDYVESNSTYTNIELCASTHRAAGVMQEIVNRTVSTAHSLFKLKPTVTKFGKETLKSSGPPEIPNDSLVIIDESSMIGNNFLKAIVPTVKSRRLKILFVGDKYQLDPTMDVCTLFDGSLPTFTLTKVHRQKGDSPILDKAIEFRDFISGKTDIYPEISTALTTTGEGVHVLPHSDFVQSFVRKYIDYDTGAVVDTPLCTFTNDSAINYNSMIRKAAYFLEGTIEPFYPGERLLSNSLVRRDDSVILTNNEPVVVEKYMEADYIGIPGYYVTLRGDYNKFTKSRVKRAFVPKTKAAADKILNELKKTAIANKSKSDWVEFYAAKAYLADLRPPFAGTTHKAQGGTFPAVFIDQVNINKCRDVMTRARLMYVALTRASKDVYINA